MTIVADVIGHVVGKEDVSDLVTKAGKESKMLSIYMEDLESNRLKCTLFGTMVDDAIRYLERENAQPLVIVVQFFKPHVYLTDLKIQNSLYTSRVYFNPDFLEVVAFRERC
ncbi:hypothetical protein PIB30_084254 [Stylosanthes scabra]|uniref:Uncharacterized protein n=1 Tax=Stylosanthes scabra TaxID=79078 RepID=A0ABU6WS57_9FABA|nr:hypothetical protein [Stylosanthes scabra]